MSLQESSQQPSGQQEAQSTPPANAEGQASAATIQTTLGGARETRPADAPAKVGDNGGPDWRAVVAGEDAKAIEELARYKTPADFLKSFREQRSALSKRAEAPKLPEKATPEQVTEYRKAMGLPEIAADAKPDDIMKAYGISAPEGYELNDVEKGMLGEWAKTANAAHVPPAIAKQAVDFLFKQNAAVAQAQRKADVELHKTWNEQLRSDLGKDYDAVIASANDYLQSALPDEAEREALLNARLPGGGIIAKHPFFAKIVSDLAMQNGFTDRIEAQSLESGGQSAQQIIQEIEAKRQTDPAFYNLPATQARLSAAYKAALTKGEMDDQGNFKRRRTG